MKTKGYAIILFFLGLGLSIGAIATSQTFEKMDTSKNDEPLQRYVDKEYSAVCYESGSGLSCVKL